MPKRNTKECAVFACDRQAREHRNVCSHCARLLASKKLSKSTIKLKPGRCLGHRSLSSAKSHKNWKNSPNQPAKPNLCSPNENQDFYQQQSPPKEISPKDHPAFEALTQAVLEEKARYDRCLARLMAARQNRQSYPNPCFLTFVVPAGVWRATFA
jgi:hypothetical protein